MSANNRILLITSLSLLIGCGRPKTLEKRTKKNSPTIFDSNSTPSEYSDELPDKNAPASALSSGDSTNKLLQMQGTWTSGCLESLSSSNYDFTFVITQNSIMHTYTTYVSTACTESQKLSQQTILGTITIGSKPADAVHPNDLNIEITDRLFTMYRPDYIAVANSDKICGKTNWSIGIEQSTFGYSGSDPCDYNLPAKPGTKIYNIYSIISNNMVFGTKFLWYPFSVAFSESLRPTTLSEQKYHLQIE